MNQRRWDIFCKVIDNFGDAGVCWRLARQLAGEYGLAVRLWIDDPSVLSRLAPGVDAAAHEQNRQGVAICRWSEVLSPEEVADVVIEAFGCPLPAPYLARMADGIRPPVWINLEYLTAESWAAGCHGLPSPHPGLPLVKHFFFPGFSRETGGLLRERDLEARRRAFLADPGRAADFLRSLGVLPPAADELVVSLFAYENPALRGLLDIWATGERRIRLLVPEGRILAGVRACFHAPAGVGDSFRRGPLTLEVIPFVDQDRYDLLLWSCHLNFVRGEDSFVRAQWARLPFVWHIYPQEDDAHRVKLAAFMDLYCENLAPPSRAALWEFWDAWNRGEGADAAWPAFEERLPELGRHAENWAVSLAQHEDLAARLVAFAAAHRP